MADDTLKKKQQNKEKDAEELLSWLGKILRNNIVCCEVSGSSSLHSHMETI
jgi:hypothetical protein